MFFAVAVSPPGLAASCCGGAFVVPRIYIVKSMGTVSSVAAPHSAILPVVNLSKEAVLSIWLSYNLLGEGWALTADQFVAIFKNSERLSALEDDQLNKIFNIFDTDCNGLIDALEVFVTIGLLSGKWVYKTKLSALIQTISQEWMRLKSSISYSVLSISKAEDLCLLMKLTYCSDL